MSRRIKRRDYIPLIRQKIISDEIRDYKFKETELGKAADKLLQDMSDFLSTCVETFVDKYNAMSKMNEVNNDYLYHIFSMYARHFQDMIDLEIPDFVSDEDLDGDYDIAMNFAEFVDSLEMTVCDLSLNVELDELAMDMDNLFVEYIDKGASVVDFKAMTEFKKVVGLSPNEMKQKFLDMGMREEDLFLPYLNKEYDESEYNQIVYKMTRFFDDAYKKVHNIDVTDD